MVSIEEFPNGHYFYSKDKKPALWYKRDWEEFSAVENAKRATDDNGEIINEDVIQNVRDGLEKAVKQ